MVPKWTIVYFCDGYHSLYGIASHEEARTRLTDLTPMLSVWTRGSRSDFAGKPFNWSTEYVFVILLKFIFTLILGIIIPEKFLT